MEQHSLPPFLQDLQWLRTVSRVTCMRTIPPERNMSVVRLSRWARFPVPSPVHQHGETAAIRTSGCYLMGYSYFHRLLLPAERR